MTKDYIDDLIGQQPTCRRVRSFGFLLTFNFKEGGQVEPLCGIEKFMQGIFDSSSQVRMYAGQAERGETGVLHYQTFLLLHRAVAIHQMLPSAKKNKIRDSFQGLTPNITMVTTKNNPDALKQSYQYCIKETTRVEGPFVFGEVPKAYQTIKGVNKKKKEYKVKDILTIPKEEIMEFSFYQFRLYNQTLHMYKQWQLEEYTHPDVRGIWFYGEPRTGKSRKAYESWPTAFRKPQNKWFDGYIGQETIILDDLDSNCLGHYLKLWADRYPVQGEIKGSSVPLKHHRFVVTSNYTIAQLFESDPILVAAIQARFTCTHFVKLPGT